MAVPKKKKSKRQTKTKHSLYMAEERRRLLNGLNLVKCKNCESLKKNHTVCKECGFYRGNKIITKKVKSATVVHV